MITYENLEIIADTFSEEKETMYKNLFERFGGKFKSTAYFRYIAAKKAQEFFKNKIRELDTNNEYFKISGAKVVSDEKIKEALLPYKEELDKIEAEKEEWKQNNLHLYRKQPSLPSSSAYNDIFDFDFEVENIKEAIEGYKLAGEIIKSIDNSSLDRYCTENKLMLNNENISIYNEAMKEIEDKYDVPSKEYLRETLEPDKVKTRLSLGRSKSTSTLYMDDFTYSIIKKLF